MDFRAEVIKVECERGSYFELHAVRSLGAVACGRALGAITRSGIRRGAWEDQAKYAEASIVGGRRLVWEKEEQTASLANDGGGGIRTAQVVGKRRRKQSPGRGCKNRRPAAEANRRDQVPWPRRLYFQATSRQAKAVPG